MHLVCRDCVRDLTDDLTHTNREHAWTCEVNRRVGGKGISAYAATGWAVLKDKGVAYRAYRVESGTVGLEGINLGIDGRIDIDDPADDIWEVDFHVIETPVKFALEKLQVALVMIDEAL